MPAPEVRPAGPPRWVWLVYLILFGLSVPWYLPAGPLRLWFGLPHWVVLSLLSMVAVAVFTTVIVRRYWPDADEAEPAPRGPGPRS